jgi:hypothetical protein
MLLRNRIAAGVVAGLFALTASNASAQDKKPAPPDTVKVLEAELARLKAMEAELQAKLKQVQMEAERQRAREAAERREAQDLLQAQVKRAQVEAHKAELEKALKLRADHLKLAQLEAGKAVVIGDDVKRGVIELQKGLVLKAGPDNPKATIVLSGMAGPAAYEKMSPQQIKELIGKLQRILDEKIRHGDDQKRTEIEKEGRRKAEVERRVEIRGGNLLVNPGQVSQEEILKRLDRLSKEVDELRRAIRK